MDVLSPNTVPPSSPQGVSHSVESSSANEVSVSVQWGYPTETGGRDDLTYTVTISPPSATVLTSTSVTVTAQYNMDYTVSVVATNCAGNSTTAEYNFRIGESISSLNSTLYTDSLLCRWLSCVDQPHEWSLCTSLQQITRIHSNHPV